MERPLGSTPFTPVLRTLTGLLGAASFGTGVLTVFVTRNGTGTGVLFAFGGVLLALALFGNRIESFELGSSSGPGRRGRRLLGRGVAGLPAHAGRSRYHGLHSRTRIHVEEERQTVHCKVAPRYKGADNLFRKPG